MGMTAEGDADILDDVPAPLRVVPGAWRHAADEGPEHVEEPQEAFADDPEHGGAREGDASHLDPGRAPMAMTFPTPRARLALRHRRPARPRSGDGMARGSSSGRVSAEARRAQAHARQNWTPCSKVGALYTKTARRSAPMTSTAEGCPSTNGLASAPVGRLRGGYMQPRRPSASCPERLPGEAPASHQSRSKDADRMEPFSRRGSPPDPLPGLNKPSTLFK